MAIENMPTAYDVDKLVKKLEKAKDEIASEDYCRSINSKGKCVDKNCFECCAEYLIEIVKQGGASDVCEWRKDGLFLYTSCGDRVNAYSDEFKYCPYCGKQIKESEAE